MSRRPHDQGSEKLQKLITILTLNDSHKLHGIYVTLNHEIRYAMTGDGKVSRGERYGKNLRNMSNAAIDISRDSLLLNSRQLGTLSTVHITRNTKTAFELISTTLPR